MSQQEHIMEDFTVGQRFVSNPVTVTEEMIIDYAKQFDPQDFHLNPERAKNTALGKMMASGWHTASLTMRMMVESIPTIKGGMLGRGVDYIDWPQAVLPGDTLQTETEIIEMRESKSNPNRGIAKAKHIVRNQDKKIVLEMVTNILLPCR